MYCFKKKSRQSIIQCRNIRRNARIGQLAEIAAANQLIDLGWTFIDSQVMIQPYTAQGTLDNYYFIADALYYDTNSDLVMVEVKSSMGAPLTQNQLIGYPQTTRYGGVIKNPINSFPNDIPPGTRTIEIRGN